MPFIRTVPPDQAGGTLAELYEQDRAAGGRAVPIIAAWSLRPDALAAWNALLRAIRAPMEARRFELVTVVAAASVKCSV